MANKIHIVICVGCGDEFKWRGRTAVQNKLCQSCLRESQSDYIPTPDEIAQATAVIRQEWSEAETERRAVQGNGRQEYDLYRVVKSGWLENR